MAAGAPFALLIGLVAPGFWLVGVAWVALIVGLTLVDAFAGAGRGGAQVTMDAPRVVAVGARGEAAFTAIFDGSGPRTAEIAVETDRLLASNPSRRHFRPASGPVHLALEPRRR